MLREEMQEHNKLTIYKLLIRPIPTYAAPVWSNTSLSKYYNPNVLELSVTTLHVSLFHTFIPPYHSNSFTSLFIA
jgi:hypothetical protein